MPDGRLPHGPHLLDTAEGQRLRAADAEGWQRWGPYLSERQWGTVREDYSADGDAWDYLPHDHARSPRLSLGRGRHRRLQRRAAALVPRAGAVERARPDPQGADVRPDQQRGQPRRGRQGALLVPRRHADPLLHADALQISAGGVSLRRAGRGERAAAAGSNLPEYELVDTGVFDEGRYFDVTVEYAKAAPDDILMRVTVDEPRARRRRRCTCCRSSGRATPGPGRADTPRPLLRARRDGTRRGDRARRARRCASRRCRPAEFLFCENETNTRRLFGIGRCRARSRTASTTTSSAATAQRSIRRATGTKCAAHAPAAAAGRAARAVAALPPRAGRRCGARPRRFRRGVRRSASPRPTRSTPSCSATSPTPTRGWCSARRWPACSGRSNIYHFDVRRWLDGDPAQPPPPAERRHGRNSDWRHLNNADIISMPDKWEYPWYAAWDLAFHCVTFALIDPGLRQGAADPADARMVHAPERPAARL